MYRPLSKLGNFFRQLTRRSLVPQSKRQKLRPRLELELLEDRTLPSAATNAVLGVAFVDANENGVRDPGEAGLPGIVVALTGTATNGSPFNTSTSTDANGAYEFDDVPTGTFQLVASSTSFVGGINTSVTMNGADITQDIAFPGLNPGAISLTQFLTTSSSATDIPSSPAGQGQTNVASPPTLSTAIAPVTVGENSAATTVDLSSSFSDANPLTYSIAANSNPGLVTATLPGGSGNSELTLNYAANETGTATITVQATDTLGLSVTGTFSVSVGLLLTPSTLPADTVNVAYNQTITGSGVPGTINLAVSNVQNAIAGLNVPTSGTGTLAITGTPTATGAETFTVTATDTAGDTTSTNYTITVNPVATLTPATLPAATINTVYVQTITTTGGTGTETLVVTNIANAIAGLTVPTTGTDSLAIAGTPTATGSETFTVTATDAVGGTTSTNYTITVNSAVTLSPATLPAGMTNTAYSQTITASGGSGTITLAVTNIANAVAGLTVPTTGTGSLAISGTPTGSGTETFTVTATDAAGATATANYSITIDPELSPSTLPPGLINVAYNQTLTTSGTGTINLAVSNLTNAIAGLTVPTSGTGSLAITGTPTAAGTETFTVTATDPSGATTSTNYSIVISSTDTPVVSTAIAPVSVAENAASTVVDLSANFGDPGMTNSEIQINTSLGPIDVTLYDSAAPQTVANFYDYINSGAYNNDVFHRLTNETTDGLAVLQGGGFTFEANPSQLVPVTAFPAVANEFNATTRPNVAGTIAMAKTTDPNSATSQFFFNLTDNSQSLDNTSNSGGFTVFGAIANAASQTVVNDLAALSVQDESSATALPASEQGVFNEIPLQNYTGTNFPTDTTSANYALITSVTILSRPQYLTYSIVSNSNPSLVTATLGTQDNNDLTLAYTSGQTGTATITVMATNVQGNTVTTSFTVTVS